LALSASKLFEIGELFLAKNWEIEDNPEQFHTLYNRFCTRIKFFDIEEHQTLFLELAYDFYRIRFQEFEAYFLKAFALIDPKDIDEKTICILPLKTKDNDNIKKKVEIKSGTFIWKYFRDYIDFSFHPFLSKAVFYEHIDSIEELLKKSKKQYYFLFIDDYIGSGVTASEALKELLSANIVNNNEIGIISFAAQITGIEYVLQVLGVDVYSSLHLSKGISDNFLDEDLSIKKEIMIKMEEKLSVNNKHKFGYMNSEALISLGEKAPNNTFPVFWHETNTRIAPFPRYKRYKHNAARN
jgi:hypothetical protein